MKKTIAALMLTGTLYAAVEDGATLFSAKAITSADKKLADIRQSTGKEIIILTTNDLGGKSISEFTRNTASTRKLNGMIVVISTKPRMLEVVPGRKTSMAFNREKVQKTLEIFKQNLRKNPDGALAEAVQFFYDTFKNASSALIVPDSHQAPMRARESSGSGSFGWLKWVFIIGGVLLIVRLISYFMNRNANPATPGTPGAAGFGGGGFFPSLMGGIFGAMAGSWLYDRFFSNHDDHSHRGDDSRSDNSDWRNDDNGDSGSGGSSDWGGGGDSGSGGGDSGGGDW